MYGKIDIEYNINDKIVIIRDKKSFNNGMIAIISEYSSKCKEYCYVKNRDKPIGKLYIKLYTNDYDNIIKYSKLPTDITNLILQFNTL
jgi:hypothetical protein